MQYEAHDKLKCVSCGHELWKTKPGPSRCPKCGKSRFVRIERFDYEVKRSVLEMPKNKDIPTEEPKKAPAPAAEEEDDDDLFEDDEEEEQKKPAKGEKKGFLDDIEIF